MATQLVARARSLSRQLLGARSDRFAHSAGVAGMVAEVAETLGLAEAEQLITAAWLHDIGYAPALARTGLHALDGAHHLAEVGMDRGIVSLVAHHSCAFLEARQRGLLEQLVRFALPPLPLMDVIDHADVTVSRRGRSITAPHRLAEAVHRHQGDPSRHQALLLARPLRLAAVERVHDRLRSTEVAPLSDARGRSDAPSRAV